MTERCELSDNDEAAKQSTTSLQINNWCENEDNSTFDNTKQGTEEANDIEYCLELIPNLNDDAHSLIIEGTSQTKHENRIENLAANNVGAIHIGDRIYVNGDAEFTGNIGGSIYQKRLRESLENRSDCTKKVKYKYGIVACVSVFIIFLLAVLAKLQKTDEPHKPSEKGGYRRFYVDRTECEAKKTVTNYTDESIEYIVVNHTGGPQCHDIQTCCNRFREIQDKDMNVEKLRDIRFNFLIGGDGIIYEGRGWHNRNEIGTNTIDIGYIGNFTDETLHNINDNIDDLLTDGFKSNVDTTGAQLICYNQIEPIINNKKTQLCETVSKHSDYKNGTFNKTENEIILREND